MSSTCEATVFYDDAGEASARIYALAAPQVDGRLLTVDELAACELDCRVEGPICRYSTTLKTRTTLEHRGVTSWGNLPALIAEAYLPDPCPWSPELPFLYRLTGSVRLGDRIIAEMDQTFGIRPLSTVRKRIVLNGKTWVPRAVRREVVVGETPLSQWRETATIMLVNSLCDKLCMEASEVGVHLIAVVRERASSLIANVRRLSRYPAVSVIAVETETVDEHICAAARNTLIASTMERVQSSWDRSQVFICNMENGDFIPGLASFPTIFERCVRVSLTLPEARAACDALQRDLAGKCDPAGYIV